MLQHTKRQVRFHKMHTMFITALCVVFVCGINVCLVQLQDMHDMKEKRNLQLVFSQTI